MYVICIRKFEEGEENYYYYYYYYSVSLCYKFENNRCIHLR